MARIGKKGYRVLKVAHILFVATWLGSGLCLLILLLADFGQRNLYGLLRAIEIINFYIIIPAGIGSLITGLLFSLLTNWGFFKHRWIVVKYLINLLPIVFGDIAFAPQLNGMLSVASAVGLEAVTNPAFLQYRRNFIYLSAALYFLLLVAFYLAYYKPALQSKPGPAQSPDA